MAEGQSMTTLPRSSPRLLARRALATSCGRRWRWSLRELMEAEIAALDRRRARRACSDERATHRNGYRPRPLGDAGRRDRAGDPQDALGAGYFPSFLEPRRRSEQALVGGGAWRPTSTASPRARSTGWSSSWASRA